MCELEQQLLTKKSWDTKVMHTKKNWNHLVTDNHHKSHKDLISLIFFWYFRTKDIYLNWIIVCFFHYMSIILNTNSTLPSPPSYNDSKNMATNINYPYYKITAEAVFVRFCFKFLDIGPKKKQGSKFIKKKISLCTVKS